MIYENKKLEEKGVENECIKLKGEIPFFQEKAKRIGLKQPLTLAKSNSQSSENPIPKFSFNPKMAAADFLPREYGYVVLVLVLYCFLNFFMSISVGKARKKYAFLFVSSDFWFLYF